MEESKQINQVIDVLMLAGTLLIESGSEIHRVEDTMIRIEMCIRDSFSIIVGLIIASRIYLWAPVKVDGHSMDPTLADSEYLLSLIHI